MEPKTIYDRFDRRALIATLLAKDEEIARLKSRNIDDYIRELIDDKIEAAR